MGFDFSYHGIISVASFLLVLSPCFTSAALTADQIAKIEDIINSKFLAEQKVPGMTVSVVQGESFEQIYSAGHGHSNIEQNLIANNETLFAVGSLSKMISSVYIVKMLNDKFPDLGEKVLDTPIPELAPDYNLTFIDRYRSQYITFRDILSHKVCVATSTDVAAGAGAFESKYDVVYRQRYCPETCHFRSTNWAYNNAMLTVAAEVATYIHGTGEAFEDLLQAFLRNEIGMKDTRLIRVNEDLDAIPNISQPYYRRGGKFLPFDRSLLTRAGHIPAAGGILTTGTDMAHFMAVIGNYGVRMDGRRVIEEHVMKWITRNSNPYRTPPTKSNDGDRPRGDMGYGLGIQLGSSDGWERLRHVGYVSPYGATMNVFPKLKLGIFTACSGPGNLGPNHDMIHNLVFDLVQGYAKANEATERHYEPWTAEDYMEPNPFTDFQTLYAKPAPVVNPTEIQTRIPHSLLVGWYGVGVGGQFEITDVNTTTLYLQFGQFGKFYLHVRPDTPAIYDAELDSVLDHHWYADNRDKDFPSLSVDFTIPLTATVKIADQVIPFIKGFTLDTLPEQPWKDDSC